MWEDSRPRHTNITLQEQYKHCCKFTRAKTKGSSAGAAEAKKCDPLAEREGR